MGPWGFQADDAGCCCGCSSSCCSILTVVVTPAGNPVVQVSVAAVAHGHQFLHLRIIGKGGSLLEQKAVEIIVIVVFVNLPSNPSGFLLRLCRPLFILLVGIFFVMDLQ